MDQPPHPAAGDGTQIILAEYSALRTEIERRSNIQWNIFALQVGSAGAVTGLSISAASNLALLLIVPLVSYMLGNRYVLHDFHLKLIRRYMRDSLSVRLDGHLQWENWRAQEAEPAVAKHRWFTATGWNVLHPTRLAFEGIAMLALAGVLAASVYFLVNRSPAWYLIAGFATGWLLGVVATVFMHRTFDKAA